MIIKRDDGDEPEEVQPEDGAPPPLFKRGMLAEEFVLAFTFTKYWHRGR